MRGKDLLLKLKGILFVKTGDIKIQDLVLIHMLQITIGLTMLSVLLNPFLSLPSFVNYITYFMLGFQALLYWQARFKKRFSIVKKVFLIAVAIMINILWMQTQGSSGPSLFYIIAFVPMYIFIVDTDKLKWGLIFALINLPLLLFIEIRFPEYIISYKSDIQRIADILIAAILFVSYEIPLLIYIKKAVLKERNEAKKSESLKTSYITNMSHEIRTPMNAILGFSELLAQDELDKEERNVYIGIINDNGNTLLNLLNNIISLSKLESNQTAISLSQFTACEFLQRIHSSLLYKTLNSEIDFKIIPNENKELLIESDITLLYQILINLTFNALKFTEKGYVLLGYDTGNDSVTFWIKDTGIGISKEKQSTIFREYEQAVCTKPALNLSGAGLGLTISKSLSGLLNADISLKSEPGKGTTFFVRLPLRFPAR